MLIFGSDFQINWGNGTVTTRWNHLFNNKLFSNLSFIYSNYDYNLGSEDENFSFNWNSKIINYNLDYDFTYYLNSDNTIKFGASALMYDFRPGEVTSASGTGFNSLKVPHENALELAAYASNEQKIGTRITVQYGLRYSHFVNYGEAEINLYENDIPRDPENPNSINGQNDQIGTRKYGQWEPIATYGGLEPRLGINFLINEVSSVKASYNRMRQYIHLVSNTNSFSSDRCLEAFREICQTGSSRPGSLRLFQEFQG